MTLILGIDPGLQHTGWGIIDSHQGRLRYIACGVIHSTSKTALAQRLVELHDGIREIITQYVPLVAAIEETFVNKNAASSLKLGHARGVAMVAASLLGLPVAEYAANLIKKSITGTGHATKEQMMMMVGHLLPRAEITSADAADALAVAICHAHMASIDNYIKG